MAPISTHALPNAGEPAPSVGHGYRAAGVDIDAAHDAVGRIATLARSTMVNGGEPLGHFGGMFRLPGGPDQMLVASADGVGTKLKLAFALGGEAHAQVGADLVNHCVNDILALGARPLFFLDYVAMARLDRDTLDRLVSGMVTACREHGVALIGGETAEMPGIYRDGEYDVAGFIVGTVAPDALVDGSTIRDGDVLVGLESGGLQTNGYSLARHIVGLNGDAATDCQVLGQELPVSDGVTLGDALMRGHPSFFPVVMPLVRDGLVRGMAHITGGGLLDNVPRMLPAGLKATIDPTAWVAPPIFEYLVARGSVSQQERFRVFNMGIGFVLAIAAADVTGVMTRLDAASGPRARIIGEVTSAEAGHDRRVIGLERGLAVGNPDV